MQHQIRKLATDYSSCYDTCVADDLQGTNGGVTWTGLAASVAGGLFMGLVFWSMGAISPRLYTVPFQQEPAIGQWSLVILGTACCTVLHNTVFTCCHIQLQDYRCRSAPQFHVSTCLQALLFVHLHACRV